MTRPINPQAAAATKEVLIEAPAQGRRHAARWSPTTVRHTSQPRRAGRSQFVRSGRPARCRFWSRTRPRLAVRDAARRRATSSAARVPACVAKHWSFPARARSSQQASGQTPAVPQKAAMIASGARLRGTSSGRAFRNETSRVGTHPTDSVVGPNQGAQQVRDPIRTELVLELARRRAPIRPS